MLALYNNLLLKSIMKNQNIANIETLIQNLPVEKTLDFIQFRTTFVNNYDFEKVQELAASLQIKRTGSRSTAWKVSVDDKYSMLFINIRFQFKICI